MKKQVLVTGSAGLIGSEAVRYYCNKDFDVVGIDNDMRKYFFGEEASTEWNKDLLTQQYPNYTHYDIDIRDEEAINDLFKKYNFDLIIHSAAQPSHDWAMKEPLTDFSVNATGTLILLEAFRNHCPEAVFIFTSTNKVYGDTPNNLPLIERETRWEIDPSHEFKNGIDESMSIDNSKHSIFGASKVAADIMVQEYGKYFNLKTGVFRGGCLTGPSHSGTQLHGFLAYLVKCIAEGKTYTIFGHKGKQVRDNIHSSDLISAFDCFYKNPRIGEVYNIGGSRHSNVSMMEAIEKIESILQRKAKIEYMDANRSGDHIWYISDVSKFQKHYPEWKYTYDIDDTISEICELGHFTKPILSGGQLISMHEGVNKGPLIFVSSHITEAYGPVQALKSELIKRYSKIIFVEHPLTYSTVADSKVETFRGSLMSKRFQFIKSNVDAVEYIKDFILTTYWFIRLGRNCKIFIGINSLNALVGVLLKKLGFKFTLIYYSVDYTPNRFDNNLLNNIYKRIDRLSYKNADYVWNTTQRMFDVRKNFGVSEKQNMLVPNGVYSKKYEKDNKDINRIVVLEHLTEEKGVDTIIKMFKDVRKINNKASLIIYGSGPFERSLKKIAKEQDVRKHIKFIDSLNPKVYMDDIGKGGVGICLHKGGPESFIHYSDPTPPKEILSVGLPLIVSKDLGLSDAVDELKLGISVNNEKEILSALKKLWNNNDFYKECSKNASKYAKDFVWEDIYNKAFEESKLPK